MFLNVLFIFGRVAALVKWDCLKWALTGGMESLGGRKGKADGGGLWRFIWNFDGHTLHVGIITGGRAQG